jgi:Peptide-N-glycosidase F, C terminal/Peptide-N-glycosidase F, N terminal
MRRFALVLAFLLAACSEDAAGLAPIAGSSGAPATTGTAGALNTGTTADPTTQAGTGATLPRDAGAPPRDAATNGAKPPIDGATDDDAGREPTPAPDAGVAADGGATSLPSMPGTFKIFDKIPMFGMYRTDEPKFTPPAGMLMWSRGSIFLARLSREQQSQIGADLVARVTYHAQCDNYDRIGGVFFLTVKPGTMPTDKDKRTELVRFITPFSDYNRGSLATYAFPNADLATYARTLADPSHDVWIGIGGGSNPYDGDPCTNTNQPSSFKEVGFLYSLELSSTKPLTPGPSTTLLTALYNLQAMKVPVDGTFDAPAELHGRVNVIVSGHGAERGGNEYMHTDDTVTVNGTQVGMFPTMIDCARYAKFSPDGNPGIFQNNTGGNPRNWCPGALVEPHTFEATLKPGMNTVRLDIRPNQVPSGSYYATSISFSAP